MNQSHLEFLKQNNHCPSSHDFVDTQPDLQTLWKKCNRGDWLMWLCDQLQVDHRLKVLTLVRHIETIRYLMEFDGSVKAIDASEKYGLGGGAPSNSVVEQSLDAASDARVIFINAVTPPPSAVGSGAQIEHAAACAAYAAVSVASYASPKYNVTEAWIATASITSAAIAAEHLTTGRLDISKKVSRKLAADICREILTEEFNKKLKVLKL